MTRTFGPPQKLPGTIQVDVDELWVYYESLFSPVPAGAPALVYEQGIPRLLDLFDEYDIQATFFICGRDLPAHNGAIAEMVRRGHEIANHTYSHPMGFARLSPAAKRAEIVRSHDLLAAAAGRAPVGFKSPGYSFHPEQLAILAGLGYLYDSSILPTPYAPILRQMPRWLNGKEVDPTHFGRARHGLAPLRPYRPDPARPERPLRGAPAPSAEPETGLWEAPVTTVPLLRLPMHSTFVLATGRLLFDLGSQLAQIRSVPVNYLLHGADVLDRVNDPALESYRFLQRSWADKEPLYRHMLADLASRYRLRCTRDFVTELQSPLRPPESASL
jgi:hypothetical protein